MNQKGEKNMININQISNKNGKIDIPLICQVILNSNRIRGTNNRLYIWQSEQNCFQYQAEERRAIYELFEPECAMLLSSHQIDEILKRLKSLPETYISMDDFDNEPQLINCKNGILDINTLKFISSENTSYNFSGQLNFEYIANADIQNAPTFAKFIDTSLCGNSDKQKLLLQTIGYSISNNYSLKCAIFFEGAPDSGKSHILNLISKVFGDNRISNLTLSDLGKRFSTSQLAFTRLNINGDLETDVLRDIATFKRILGGDRIFAEYKGKDGFMFTPRVHLLYACNNLPLLKEVQKSDAYIKRIVLLHFPVSVSKENQDPNLLDKLWSERNIIFSAAIKEFANVITTTRSFDVDVDSSKVLQSYKDILNPVEAFMRYECIHGEDYRIHKNTFYNVFKRWCEDNDFSPKLNPHDISTLVLKNPHIQVSKFRLNGSQPMHGFIGIKLKSEN